LIDSSTNSIAAFIIIKNSEELGEVPVP